MIIFKRLMIFSLLVICSLPFPSCESKTQSETNREEGFVDIFDGETLNGWEGDPVYWRADSGMIIGEVTPKTILKRNTFIIWRKGLTANFEIKLSYKISAKGNSGVNYRSTEVENIPHALRGYQADIDGRKVHIGQNYEERGRRILARRGQKVRLPEVKGSIEEYAIKNVWTAAEVIGSVGDRDVPAESISDDWNEMHIIVNGNHMRHFINGALMVEVFDDDLSNRNFSGLLGMQVHVGPPMKVSFKDIRLKTL